ncbi:MAG: hypothetical protein HRT68_14005 [Flavobacteriaceae bacterium]|nr:hypothetical protein [Flavobacteriaceae bacterium]
MKTFLGILCGILLLGCNSYKLDDEIYMRRYVTYDNYKHQFQLTEEDLNPVHLKTYYWYKSQRISNSVGGYSGSLLTGDYTKYYITNNLAEKGEFKRGLKHGVWKSWFENGKLKSITSWKKGTKDGIMITYNEDGKLLTRGRYVKNIKEGPWVDTEKGDTLHFRSGKVRIETKPKEKDSTKTGLFQKVFKKKKKKEQISE